MSDEKRPREFWCWKGDGYQSNCHEITDPKYWTPENYFGAENTPDDLIRVIEHSAYAAVTKERDELKARLASAKALDNLLSENGEVVELQDDVEELEAKVENLKTDKQFLHKRRGELVIERDALRSELDAAEKSVERFVGLNLQSRDVAWLDDLKKLLVRIAKFKERG